MALFEQYDVKRKALLSKMQSLEEFEKTDKTVGLVFNISRQILGLKGAAQNVQWLLQNGSKLSAYFGYLDGKANQTWAEYKVAEIAFKQVRDALMLAIKNEKSSVTEARAEAGRETGDVEVDVIVKEKRSRDYETAAKMCERMLSFIQSSLRHSESERAHTKLPDAR